MKKTIAVVAFLLVAACAFGQTIKVEMVRIPSGTFQMGKDLVDSKYDQTPVHTVTLSAFSMSKYEVTQDQYYAVMGVNPSYFSSNPATGETQGRRPVDSVTWYDAIEFCNKLSVLEGLTPAYTINKNQRDPNNNSDDPVKWTVTWNRNANGYRLPTEAEWEYAAKGGNPNAPGWIGYIYSGSNDVSSVAWHRVGNSSGSHEVGKKAPNGLGLYDMTGNVHEWCWDWDGKYSIEAQTNPVGATSGFFRVVRGSDFGDTADSPSNRTVTRFSTNQSIGQLFRGFRIVRP